MSFEFTPIKYTFWSTFGDNTPNDFIASYIEPRYGNADGVAIRRRLAREIGCTGLRRGIEYYVNDAHYSMYSERHCMVGFAEVLAPVTVESKKEAQEICANMELKQ